MNSINPLKSYIKSGMVMSKEDIEDGSEKGFRDFETC